MANIFLSWDLINRAAPLLQIYQNLLLAISDAEMRSKQMYGRTVSSEIPIEPESLSKFSLKRT